MSTYSYCASGDTLTVTPQMSGLTGTVVLQREGTGGAGGTGGTGGGRRRRGRHRRWRHGGSGGTAAGGSGGAGGSPGGTRPCDIYAAANNTCVAAHSTVRALFSAYSGNLYQVKRAGRHDQGHSRQEPGRLRGLRSAGVVLQGSTCTIWRVYDQSGHGNFLEAQTPDSTVGGRQGQTAANAAAESLNVGGNKVYSLYTRPSQAYWRDGSQSGMPLGAEPQGHLHGDERHALQRRVLLQLR